MKGWQNKIAKCKFWAARTYTYISLWNGIMMGYLVLGRMYDKGVITFNPDKYFLVIILGTFVITVLIGWLEDKVGLASAEYRLSAQRMGLRQDE